MLLVALGMAFWASSTFTGVASATGLTWSSVDYAVNPASENVLGQGLFQLAGSTIGVRIPDSVSCPSATQCTAFGNGGAIGEQVGAVATFDPSPLTEGPRAVVDTNNGNGFTGTCISTSLCVAGDELGYAFSFNPTAPGKPEAVGIDTATVSGGLSGGFACPSAEECVALDPGGKAFVFNPSSLTVPGTKTISLQAGSFYSYYAIACASSTQCTAVGKINGEYGLPEVTFNPEAAGTPETHLIGTGTESGLSAISCPSLTQCTAVGNGNDEITFDPNAPASLGLTAFSPRAEAAGVQGNAQVTCASTEECFATVPGSNAVDQGNPAAGGTWTAEEVPDGAGVTWGQAGTFQNPLDCVSAVLCVGAGPGVTVGGVPTAAPPVSPPVSPPVQPTVTSPFLKGGFLKGLAKRRAVLSFVVDAGANTPDLSAITVTLPPGLSFVRSVKRLTKAISVGNDDGGPLKFAISLSHGKLTIKLKTPQAPGSETSVTILSKGLSVGAKLAGKVRHRKLKRVTVGVGAVNVAHGATELALGLKV